MATTTNYGWTTPDNTALVKDGASAIRTLGSSVDTSLKALNPSTTLGDIEYRSATANTNTRLGIGTSGQVLAVNGSGVPAWTTPAGGAETWTLLSTTSLNSGTTSVTVTGLSKDKLMVVIRGVSNTGGGSAYYWIAPNGVTDTGAHVVGIERRGTSTMIAYDNTIDRFPLAEFGSDSTSVASGYMILSGCKATSGVKAFHGAGGVNKTATDMTSLVVGGVFGATAATTSITFGNYAVNMDAGTMYIYGV
jgi:hypothetical protein